MSATTADCRPLPTSGAMALAALVLAILVGCGGPPQPPPVAGTESAALAQPELPPGDPRAQAWVDRGGFPEYVIGPGDQLTITLRDVESRAEKVTVRPDGNVSFALAEDVRAAGRTPTELDSALTVNLGRFLRQPKVDVEVTEYRSKMVSMLGALQTVITSGTKTGQGRYALRGRTTVLDLILEAGGTTQDAQLSNVQLVRQGRSYGLDLQRTLSTGDQRHNPVLEGGDIIIVPGVAHQAKKVIVLGEVRAPNVYLLPEDASLLEALSRAGGLTGDALRNDVRLIRPGPDGPQMLTANFERIASGGDLRQNVVLQNNDILYVPRSFMGDVNDVIAKVEPILNLLLLPASYRDLYTTGGGLRIDTGTAPEGGSVFVRPLPGSGTAKPAPAEPEAEDEE